MSFRALNSGVTGIKNFQTALDNIGNNLANINTVGFKAGRVDFAEALTQTLRAGTPDAAGGGASGSAAIQVGNGVAVSGVKNLFTQGAVNQTGITTDLAISGDGFFIVENTNSGEQFATRGGDFRLDSNGFLVTNQGYRVQGFSEILDPAETEYDDTATIGHIMLDKGSGAFLTGHEDAGITNISIDQTGKIQVLLEDGFQYVRGQVLLQNFQNPNALLKQGNNLYSGLSTAGPVFPTAGATPDLGRAQQGGLGRIDSGALEVSNVDIAREFANLITTQRAFQANSRVITASDDMLQEIIRVVR